MGEHALAQLPQEALADAGDGHDHQPAEDVLDRDAARYTTTARFEIATSAGPRPRRSRSGRCAGPARVAPAWITTNDAASASRARMRARGSDPCAGRRGAARSGDSRSDVAYMPQRLTTPPLPPRRLRVREHGAVGGRGREQLGVRTNGGDAPVREQHDPVRERDRRGPVGDDDRRAAAHHFAQRVPDLVLLGRVDRRRRVVEDQHARIGKDRARDRDALPLSARQREPVLAEQRLVALGEVVDELVRTGKVRARSTCAASASSSAKATFERTLSLKRNVSSKTSADRVAQLGEHEVSHVDAVEEHPALRRRRRSAARGERRSTCPHPSTRRARPTPPARCSD